MNELPVCEIWPACQEPESLDADGCEACREQARAVCIHGTNLRDDCLACEPLVGVI